MEQHGFTNGESNAAWDKKTLKKDHEYSVTFQFIYFEELNEILYIAFYDDKVAGCIALKKIDKENCEMKRLYVRNEFRGKHIGANLVNRIIDDARLIGYKHILLDTLPFLKSAIKMYKSIGFYEIDKYNNSPMDNAIYLKLDLDK